jgi:hypothetical protein
MEEVTSKLQQVIALSVQTSVGFNFLQLYCTDCGLEVYSQDTCCCSHVVRNNLSAYRVHSPAVNLLAASAYAPEQRFHGIRLKVIDNFFLFYILRSASTAMCRFQAAE